MLCLAYTMKYCCSKWALFTIRQCVFIKPLNYEENLVLIPRHNKYRWLTQTRNKTNIPNRTIRPQPVIKSNSQKRQQTFTVKPKVRFQARLHHLHSSALTDGKFNSFFLIRVSDKLFNQMKTSFDGLYSLHGAPLHQL